MITNEQIEMIDMVIEGKPITNIARILNKSRATIYAWLKLDEVIQEMERRKIQLKQAAKDKITSNVESYINNLIDLAFNSKDQRIKFQANKYLIDQCLGTPTTAKEETNIIGNSEANKDTNTLKKELDDIKNFKVIK